MPIRSFLLSILFLAFSLLCTAQQITYNPDPARFSEQIKSFNEWDEKNSFPDHSILFVGSSSIRMWKTHCAFPEYPIINRGFGGSHISDLRHFYEKVVSKYNPAVVVFYAGDNDVAAGKSIDQVFEDYKLFTDQLLNDYPNVRFIYLPIKPSSSRWNHWKEMNKVNQRIQGYNKENDQLYYVDLATPLLDVEEGQADNAYFLKDQLHLNQKGYKVWNQVLGPELEKIYNYINDQT